MIRVVGISGPRSASAKRTATSRNFTISPSVYAVVYCHHAFMERRYVGTASPSIFEHGPATNYKSHDLPDVSGTDVIPKRAVLALALAEALRARVRFAARNGCKSMAKLVAHRLVKR